MDRSRNIAGLHVGLMQVLVLAAGLVPLGAAAQDAGAAQASQPAQETRLGEDPFSVMMKWRPSKEAPEMPDFVRQTRPPEEQLGYRPLTDKAPSRPPRKTPAELAATIGKLDAAAAANRTRAAGAFPAARPAPKRPVKPADEE